jgi:hypothetical protein
MPPRTRFVPPFFIIADTNPGHTWSRHEKQPDTVEEARTIAREWADSQSPRLVVEIYDSHSYKVERV